MITIQKTGARSLCAGVRRINYRVKASEIET